MLRPISFKILSTTQLKIGFNLNLSTGIGVDNFKIESVSGSDKNVDILSVSLDKNEATINTRPHYAKAYYVLKLIDSDKSNFISEKGISLINDDISRDIYFIGVDKVNQIKDDILFKTPSIYAVDNTLVSSVLGIQADQLLKAQHAIGSVLNDNYISELSENEYRVRSSGATDRLSNENAYEIERVSLSPSGTNIINKTIEIESSDIYPINLKQEFVELFSINNTTQNASFNGFLISVPNKNIIKLSYLKVIKSSDAEDCDGNIGTIYNIDKYKYSIKNNRYDQKNSFSNFELESNQILISDFGNISRPEFGDTIILSYYYENNSISIIESSIEVYETVDVLNESIPSNSKFFTLKNSNLIDSLDNQPEIGGIEFKISENSTDVPYHFSRELKFNFSSLPKSTGEYTVNYQTGDVYVVGSSIGEGTGYNYFFANYKYKNVYKNNLDYNLYNSELNLNYLRPVFGKNIKISFDYETIFSEDIDYKPMVHQEVLGENVNNNVTSSFSLKTNFGPITDVFRIYNQTTGEIYSLNYFYDNNIYFTGNKLPTTSNSLSEDGLFVRANGEELIPAGRLLSPMHYAKITSNASNTNIEFYPGIPAELISELNTEYFIRFLDLKVDDYKIISFYNPDSNNLISGFSIQSELAIPTINSRIQVGPYIYFFDLKNNKIMNQTGDGVGSSLNSSVSFDSENFINEKYFEPINKNKEISVLNSGSQLYAISDDQLGVVNKNLSRLRSSGDYSIDYNNGVVYLASSYKNYFGLIFYNHASHAAQNKNIIAVSNISKKISGSDSNDISVISYESTFDSNFINISDLESTTHYYNKSSFINNSGELEEKLIVNDDFTIKTDYQIRGITSINKLQDIFGKDLDSNILVDRVMDSSSKNLLKNVADGGKNYYSKNSITFYENVIDLKLSSRSKINLLGSNFEIRFKTQDIKSVYNLKNKSDQTLLDQNLNFIIQNELIISSIIEVDVLHLNISINNLSNLYSFNLNNDYIIVNDSRWKITDFDGLNSFTIEKYSENYGEEFNYDLASLSIRPLVTYGAETKIIYPYNLFITANEVVVLNFITNNSLVPGDAVCIDYRYGNIFFDYIYLNDTILVYYEYGDNEIDWSINNSILEGQGYYVTYRYGALRSGLRRNFGRLTSIPFFDNQSYSIDREFYRDAVAGVLSAYPKGPTTDAISGLVKSVVKTTPTIKELSLSPWILGRDYLSPAEIGYKGTLEFSDGKFGSGLKIKEDNSVFMPAISNLSLDEGTFEAWITPDWYGINNDATLTFDFDNIGEKKFYYIGGDPFSSRNGYDVACSTCDSDHSGFDFTGGKLTIYKAPDVDGYASYNAEELFGIFNKKIVLNRETKIKTDFEFSINDSYLPLGSESFEKMISDGSFKSSIFLSDFDHKLFSAYTEVETYKVDGSTLIFSDIESEKDLILNFNPPYPTVGCSCYYPNQNNILENFDKLEIEIKLDSPLSFNELFNYDFMSSFSIKSLLIIDQEGRFYQVTGSRDYYGDKVETQTDLIYGFFVSRYPINYPSITSKSYDEINSINISKFVIAKKVFRLNLKENSKSVSYFNLEYSWLFDWDKKEKVSYYIDPIGNVSYISTKLDKYQFFYTDLQDSNLLLEFGVDSISKSTAIGVFGTTSINVYKNLINIYYKFNLNDIYIGSNSIKPNKSTFSLNRLDGNIDVNGISNFIDSNDGIYIGYDSNCLSPINENIGQWLIKSRFLKYSKLPYDIELIDGCYSNLYEHVYIDNPITGKITTDGTYSSISHMRTTLDGSCELNPSCSLHLRFLGNKLLESDGWSVIQNSDSDYIDFVNGGREAESILWNKTGDFKSNNISGIYRVYDISEFGHNNKIELHSQVGCINGNIDYNISVKILNFDNQIFDTSNQQNEILSSGIIISKIKNNNYSVGILLSADINKNLMISLLDCNNNLIIKSSYFNWNNNEFNNYNIIIDKDNNIVKIIVNNTAVLQLDLSLLSVPTTVCADPSSDGISIVLYDSLLNNDSAINYLENLILDISTIEYSSRYIPGLDSLENDDIFIVSDNVINFEFHPNPIESDDDLYDGYIQEADIDEIMITSDIERYIVDSAIDNSTSRFSIFKDGKGFLNFRIIDGIKNNKTFYNLATSIRHFTPGEKHHIAASWKLNSDIEKDEMHLFLDGQEAPNLFKFGGAVPTRINSKFSDISKEYLQNHIYRKIIFPETITDGEVVAGSNILYSSIAYLYSDLIGRTIIFSDLGEPESGALVILEVGDGWVALGNIDSLEPYVFGASGSNIRLSLAPYCSNIMTDIENDKFSVFRVNCSNQEEELGGLEYVINNNSILIKNNPGYYHYRYNPKIKIIEFVYRNSDCRYVSSINNSDIDIHIKTYGLISRRYHDIISISSSSIFLNDPEEYLGLPNNRNNYSIVMTSGPRPKDLSDVTIKKYILHNHSITEDFITEEGFANFSIDLSEATLSSSFISSFKNNDGRYLEIKIESDNILYSAANNLSHLICSKIILTSSSKSP